jgi:nucleoside-diphosphate-sugar epimerase
MIYVLGASGRLGRMLHWAWQDRRDVTWHSGRGAGNLLDPSPSLAKALQTAEVIINLSGVTPAPGADLDANIPLGTAPFALAPTARILTASSAAVYGIADLPHIEDEPLAPPSPYGLAKMQMETAIHQATQGRDHIVMRIGNVAGADQLLGGLGDAPPNMHCFADGTSPQRSYIGPRGLADAFAALISAPRPQTPAVNIAAASVSMAALLTAAGRTYVEHPAPQGLPPQVALDTERLATLCPTLRLARTPQDIVKEWIDFRTSGF